MTDPIISDSLMKYLEKKETSSKQASAPAVQPSSKNWFSVLTNYPATAVEKFKQLQQEQGKGVKTFSLPSPMQQQDDPTSSFSLPDTELDVSGVMPGEDYIKEYKPATGAEYGDSWGARNISAILTPFVKDEEKKKEITKRLIGLGDWVYEYYANNWLVKDYEAIHGNTPPDLPGLIKPPPKTNIKFVDWMNEGVSGAARDVAGIQYGYAKAIWYSPQLLWNFGLGVATTMPTALGVALEQNEEIAGVKVTEEAKSVGSWLVATAQPHITEIRVKTLARGINRLDTAVDTMRLAMGAAMMGQSELQTPEGKRVFMAYQANGMGMFMDAFRNNEFVAYANDSPADHIWFMPEGTDPQEVQDAYNELALEYFKTPYNRKEWVGLSDEEVLENIRNRSVEVETGFNPLDLGRLVGGTSRQMEDRRIFKAIVDKFGVDTGLVDPLKLTDIFTGTPTEDNPLGVSEKWREALYNLQGFTVTHMLDYEAAQKYAEYVKSGMNPYEARRMTENPWIEAAFEIGLDPFNKINIDRWAIQAMAAPSIAATKGIFSKIIKPGVMKVPGLNRVVASLGSVTYTTLANRGARQSSEGMYLIHTLLEEAGDEVTAEAVEQLLKNPPAELANYMVYRRAGFEYIAANMEELLPQIAKGIEQTKYAEFVTETMQEFKRLMHLDEVKSTRELEAFRVFKMDKDIDAIVNHVRNAAYAMEIDTYMAAHPRLAKYLEKTSGLRKVTQYVRGTLVDSWLGLSPRWNVFNKADNIIKLISEGANPFMSIRAYAERYAKHLPNYDEIMDAVYELDNIKWWQLDNASTEAFVRALTGAAPEEVLGSLGRSFGADNAIELARRGSLWRNIPITRSVVEFFSGTSSRVEIPYRLKLYMKTYDEQYTVAWKAMQDEVWRGVLKETGGNIDPIVRALRERVSVLDNPTPQQIAKVFSDVMGEGKIAFTDMSKIDELIDSILGGHISEPMRKSLRSDFMDAVVKAGQESDWLAEFTGRAGVKGFIQEFAIEEVIDKAAREMAENARATVQRSIDALADSLPDKASLQNPQRLLDTLLPDGLENATDAQLIEALGDMPLLGKTARLHSEAMSIDHWATISRLYKEKATPEVIQAAQDKFLIEIRKEFWDGFEAARKKMSYDVAEELSHRMKGTFSAETFTKVTDHDIQVRLNLLGGADGLGSFKDYADYVDRMKTLHPGVRVFGTQEELNSWLKANVSKEMLDSVNRVNIETPNLVTGTLGYFNADTRGITSVANPEVLMHEFTHAVIWKKLGGSTQAVRANLPKYSYLVDAYEGFSKRAADPDFYKQFLDKSGNHTRLSRRAQWIHGQVTSTAHTRWNYPKWARHHNYEEHFSNLVGMMYDSDYDDVFKHMDPALRDAVERFTKDMDVPLPKLTKQGAVDELYGAIARYTDASENMSASIVENYRHWSDTMGKLRFGGLDQAARDQLYKNTRDVTDKLYKEMRIRAMDEMHQAQLGITDWAKKYAEPGINWDALLGPGKWADIDAMIDRIPDSDLRRQLEQLQRFRDELIGSGVRVNTVSRLNDSQKNLLYSAADKFSEGIGRVRDESYLKAVKQVQDTYFDYETRYNWEKVVGNIVPFPMFPSRNIPYWWTKFYEKPHAAVNILRIRMAQAQANSAAGVPSRLLYSVPIPRVLTDWFTKAVGMDNTTLYMNPWMYWSFMQQLPGSSPYQQSQLRESSQRDLDSGIIGKMDALTTVASQLGFGMWPYLEWTLGSFGLLGDTWYPMDMFSTYAPVVDYAAREVLGIEGGFDINVHMRSTAPRVWNALFSGTPMEWQYMTPDMMGDWLEGRHIEGVISELPQDLETMNALLAMTPAEMSQTYNNLEDEQIAVIRAAIIEVLESPIEEQASVIQGMTPEEKSVLYDELQRIAKRRAVREQALTSFVGTMSGIYFQPVTDAELKAKKLREDRRLSEQQFAPGEERRSYMSQWYADHPEYNLISSWRFGEYPWAETEIGQVMERLDSRASQYQSRAWEYNRSFQEERQRGIAEIVRLNPGDYWKLREFNEQMYAERTAYLEQLNQEFREMVQLEYETYIMEHPGDTTGAKRLMEGWETNVYVPTQLSEGARATLNAFRQEFPEDTEGYKKLFSSLYMSAAETSPPIEKRKIPGLEDIRNQDIINLHWTPEGNPNYTRDEIRQYLIGNTLREIYDLAPQREDFSSSKEYWDARRTWENDFSEHALELPEVQKQVESLMYASGVTKQRAEETVKSWYTLAALQEEWRKNDSIYEALQNTYVSAYVDPFDDIFYGEEGVMAAYNAYKDARNANEDQEVIDELYAKYAFLQADIEIQAQPIEAADLAAFVMQAYPGRWQLKELIDAYEGITMPAYTEYMQLRKRGTSAVEGGIDSIYYDLPSDVKKLVREEFGPVFQDVYLSGKKDSVSIEQKGEWFDALQRMMGSDTSWRDLPGVESEVMESSMAEAHEFGLPKLRPTDLADFNAAQLLNREYWVAKQNGEDVTAYESDPLWQKWFRGSTASAYFWYVYYKLVPPGKISSEIRSDPLVSIIVDKDARHAAAAQSDYDRASTILEQWVEENGDMLAEHGLLQEEYEQVRELSTAYYAIPYEDKAARKQFLAENPLLKKYLYPSTSSGPGGTTSGGGTSSGGRSYSGQGTNRSDSVTAWAELRAEVGQSFASVMRILSYYWSNGELPDKSEAYLRRLYEKLGVEVSFEDWLGMLKEGWTVSSGYNSARNLRSVPRPPEPDYSYSPRGYRQR